MKVNMKNNIAAFVILTFIGLTPLGQRLLAQTPYDLPNTDADCPGNCRQIPWSAGSDQWNGGSLPVYAQVTCTGLAGNGTTNDGPAIQACITAAAANTAVYIPAGVYYVNQAINMKSNVVLRGATPAALPYLPTANPAATTFKIGASGQINFGGGSMGSNVGIASGYNKGSTALVMNTGSGITLGNWILISENPDPAIPATATGDIGTCTWCGENDGVHLMAQFAQVTSVSGNNITISRPMYYTFKSSLSPVARVVTMGVTKAGLENIRLDGSVADHGAFIRMSNSLFSWVKGVETYDAGTAAKAAHVIMQFSHGNEVRDSYFHYGRDGSSDRNYGVFFMFSNSDHKVENNILRNHRHSITFEGGGTGTALLYNYIDDNYTDDLSYLGSARTNHGAHPYMNLFEGNIISHITADSYWGSSSHNTFFRNWLWGDETQSTDVPSKPNWGSIPLDVWYNQNYYSFVGNVLGVAGKWMNPTWSSYTLRNSGCSQTSIYSYGCNSNGVYSSTTNTTSINHGNYDFKTAGVAFWEGGSNHTLRTSMYYNTKPSFFGSCAWPAFGPDVVTITNTLPAKARFEGVSLCGGSGTLAPPTNLATSVH